MSIRTLLAAASACALLIADAPAQVDYVRELTMSEPLSGPVMAMTQAPYETSSPSYSNQPRPYLLTKDAFYTVDSATGVVGAGVPVPAAAKLNPTSVATFAGQNIGQPVFRLVTAQNRLATVSPTGIVTGLAELTILPESYSSLAARSRNAGLVSLIADQQHYTVNADTGDTIAAPLAGVNMSAAFYQSYGQDGNLYVLDYANSRMAGFDPNDNFAFLPLKSFNLNTAPGIITANVQFAIGLNGSFYLADGLGGGTYYNSAGQYQGAFFTPASTVGDSYIGASYVSTDSSGRVYVYDNATGFHQFQDMAISSIPEPTTYAIGIAALLGGLILRRRRAAV